MDSNHSTLPLFQEGPHCAMKDDEFYDAVDTSIDKIEKEQDRVCVLMHVIPTVVPILHFLALASMFLI